jgi:hypothetical protein
LSVTGIVDRARKVASERLWRDRLPMVPTLSLEDQVDKVAQRLADEFSGSVPDPELRRIVVEVYGEMSTARVTQFLPVLVDRGVRARLRARAS